MPRPHLPGLPTGGVSAREARSDVVVVGAGVVGAAIARELALGGASCTLLEAGADVGAGTSKANTALLHTGFDAKPGTLEARLVRRGHELLSEYAGPAGIPLERIGALLVAWSEDELARLDGILARARENGHAAIRAIDRDELREREPNLGPGARGALEIPDEGILCPFTITLAFATEAVMAGCRLRRATPVTAASRLAGGGFRVETPAGTFESRYLVNAAGLRSDDVDRMLGYERFTVTPRRGELLVFDKLARPLLSRIVLAVPTRTTKGVLIAPTVYGNVLLGPTAEDLERKDDTASTAAGIEYLRREAERIMPELLAHEVTAIYAGLRAATEHDDYQLAIDEGYVCAAGIRSTGVSASLAIAEHVREALAAARLALREPSGALPPRMPNIGELADRPYRSAELIARDPEYGRVICFCERVTRGEIRDALASPVPPTDPDGLRRRTRALMGRCQGFYCGARVRAMLSAATGTAPEDR